MLLHDLARLGMQSPGKAGSISLGPKLSAKPQCGLMVRSQEIHKWFDFSFKDFIFNYVFICVSLCGYMHTGAHTGVFVFHLLFERKKNSQKRPEEGVVCPGAGVIDFCEPLNIDPGR